MKIRDERVEQNKNKILAELMRLVCFFVVISFVVKSLYFKMDLSQCITEYVIIIFAPIYQMVRSRQLGVVLTTNLREQLNPKRNIIMAILGVVVFFFIWFTSGRQVTKEFAFWYIATFLVAFFLIRVVFVRSEEGRIKKLEKEFEDD
ncbi:hypothetical protein CLNEO_01910 [Anaerotignum neopropionicum]|uniref:Uncharacterized protein n=1 Tax=Anaerotignum neopropionicum TaxID=36847 RepID=A0A136WHS7_9FIRM|nr:DUF6773 family protein [Anaerotignum neopropionicum]KXL54095.1 hypothetical protein CLNEO_01910 [Anaerotignum neopropionicum]